LDKPFASMDILINLIEIQFIPRALISAGIILILFLLRWIIIRTIYKYSNDVRFRYNWRKWTSHIGFLLSAILIISVWFEEFSSVLTFLGLLSAGIAIALREPVVNFFGWIFLLWRKPFSVGDRIKIGNDTGDVIDIRIFQFSVMEVGAWVNSDQYTGRIIDIPNGKVFTEQQYNFNKQFPYIWNEISFRVTFESNIERVKEIINTSIDIPSLKIDEKTKEILSDIVENYIIYNATTDPQIYFKVVENGISFTFRYLCKFNERRTSEQLIWENLINAIILDSKVNFAYPTQRFVTEIDSIKNFPKLDRF